MSPLRDRPGARARPLDQGKEPTCTAHAVSNAVCDNLMTRGIDVDQKAFIGGLMQLLTDTKGKNPMELNGLVVKRMIDETTGHYGNVLIEVQLGKGSPNKKDSHVIVYPLDEGGQTAGSSRSTHCVFINTWYRVGDMWMVDCINSWGKKKPNPQVKANMSGNKIYRINPVWTPLNQTNIDQTITKTFCTVMSPWQPPRDGEKLEDQIDSEGLSCPTCGKRFEGGPNRKHQQNRLQQHMQVHQPRNLACPVCQEVRFRTPADVAKHIEEGYCKNLSDNRDAGRQMVYSFARSKPELRPFLKKPPMLEFKGSQREEKDIPPPLPYQCNSCEKPFPLMGRALQHKRDRGSSCQKESNKY